VAVVREAVRRAPLDIVQLHREEPIDFARWVGVPAIKAFGLGEREGGAARRPGYHHFVLVDSVVDRGEDEGEGDGEGERVSRGTGKTCDRTKARELMDRGEIVVDPTLILPSSEVVEVGGVVRLVGLRYPKHPNTPDYPRRRSHTHQRTRRYRCCASVGG
jgi:hypothetical protein